MWLLLLLTLTPSPSLSTTHYTLTCNREPLTTMDNAKRRDTRSLLGLSRELEVPRDQFDADPSRGGSRGYPLWYRIEVLEYANIHGVAAAATRFTPCQRTIELWMERPIPYEMAGGASVQVLLGLTSCCFVFFFLYTHIREGTLLFPYGDNIIDTLIIKIHKIILWSTVAVRKLIIVGLSLTFHKNIIAKQ